MLGTMRIRSAICALQIILAVLAFSLASAGEIPVDADRLALAKELNRLVGTEDKLKAMLPYVIKGVEDALVAAYPSREKEVRETCRRIAVKFADRSGELVDLIAGIYAEKFTLSELQELVAYLKLPKEKRDAAAFRQSPLGQKFVQLLQELSKKGSRIGQAWGEGIGREVDEEIRKELRL